jgi:DNA invertase Pin-like site-specific DNA recombinase
MTKFQNWTERLVAARGVLPTALFYTRKSTAGEDRQVASHDQQRTEIQTKAGMFDETWWFADSSTGTTFDRRQFEQMRGFCKHHPRKKADPGKIYIYDPSRFGRVLDEEGKPDILAFLAVYGEFESAGWQLHFVTVNRIGDNLADIVTMALYAYSAAIYSTNLSKNVKRGMADHAAQGWWTGGSAPWGTKRQDTRSGRVLKSGQASTPGGGGTVLVPDEPILAHWTVCANRFLAGASRDQLGEMLADKGVRGPRGGKLGHRSIANFLTNVALIGMIEYTPDGGEPVEVKAKWEPFVDVDLFRAVQKEMDARSNKARNKHRKKRGVFPLKPVCAQCAAEYHGGRLAKKQGRSRAYVHTKAKRRIDEEALKRFKECNCSVWYVGADVLETGIKDLIIRERGSKEFEDLVRDAVLERDEFRKEADTALASAREDVQRLERQNGRIAQSLAVLSANDDFDIDAFEKEAKMVQKQLADARSRLGDAETFARSREDAWERLSAIIDETRNLGDAWPKLSDEEKKVLLDYWVFHVEIVVERVPGKLRANTKFAVVTLRTAPHDPKFFALNGQEASASVSSDLTDASDSTASLDETAALASAEPILPSAQAACARTSGSGSDSAGTSAGTASGDPQFPSDTQTLRANPARPARRIADPLENESHAASSSATASNSTSEGASVPGCEGVEPDSGSTPNGGSPGPRAAYPASELGAEKERVNGQTSWQMSHP